MTQTKTKPTNGQLQKRISKAVIMLDRTKETKEITFVDKGLRLTVDDSEGYALIATGYHTHCFQSWTSNGISRPFLYTKRMIEIANKNLDAIVVKDKDGNVNGYSFLKLLEVLKAKEDKNEYNIAVYYEWWLQIIFANLYSIDETEVGSFLVYEAYLHHIARNGILLSEKNEDITNKQFISQVTESMKEFVEGIDERVIFHKMTDEEMAQANIEALAQDEQEQAMEAQINGGK